MSDVSDLAALPEVQALERVHLPCWLHRWVSCVLVAAARLINKYSSFWKASDAVLQAPDRPTHCRIAPGSLAPSLIWCNAAAHTKFGRPWTEQEHAELLASMPEAATTLSRRSTDRLYEAIIVSAT